MEVFGKSIKGPLDINKSWQQVGFISNLSVMGHLEMVSQVLNRTAGNTSSMECEKILNLMEVENRPGRCVQDTFGDAMDTLKGFER